MNDREKDVSKWVAELLDDLICGGMDEDAHHRYRDQNSIEDPDGEHGIKPIEPPTSNEIVSVPIDGVMRYLMPLIRIRLEQVVEDFAREDESFP